MDLKDEQPVGNDYELDDIEDDDTSAVLQLHVHNVGDGTACCGCGPRTLVSKKKRRFIGDGVDLDLSYITNRVMAMGYPATGWEVLWRNPAEAVREFLERRHRFHYRIWNLCSEREYGTGNFNCEVERFAWADHTPPPLAMVCAIPAAEPPDTPTYLACTPLQMLPACESIDSWLESDAENVVIVHCKAGKGRTGTLISAYLLHARSCTSAADAVQLFGVRRTKNGRGLTIPSQIRYVRYYAFQLAALRYAANHLTANTSSTTNVVTDKSAPVEAQAVVIRQEPDIMYNAAHPSGSERTKILVEVTRDSARTPGFAVDIGPNRIPIVSRILSKPDAAATPAAADRLQNSVVPVPIHAILREGDEILAVNGVDVVHRSLGEVVSIIRGALDPLRIELRRVAKAPEAASSSDSNSSETVTTEDYVQRVARGIGPWASGADPRFVPLAPIKIRRIQLSHVPNLASKKSIFSCGGRGLEDDEGWYVMIHGGPGCRSVLYDTRTSASGYAVHPAPGATSAQKSVSGAVGGKAVEMVPLSATSTRAYPVALEWPQASFVSAPVVQSDIRLVVMKEGFRKPFASIWLNTACLPVPAEVRQPLHAVIARQRAVSVVMSPLESATPALLKSDETPSPATRVTLESAEKEAVSLLSSPTLAVSSVSSTPASPPATGADKETGMPSSPAAGGVAPAACAPRKSVVTKGVVIDRDVPDTKIGTCTPLLGAIYSAARSAKAGAVATELEAASSITFIKSEIDGVVKDKKHRVFPGDFTITVDFSAVHLPGLYSALLHGTATSETTVALRI